MKTRIHSFIPALVAASALLALLPAARAAGHYTVVAAHRKAGSAEKTVDVRNQDVRLDFTLAAKAVS
jgi:hypothetical protein